MQSNFYSIFFLPVFFLFHAGSGLSLGEENSRTYTKAIDEIRERYIRKELIPWKDYLGDGLDNESYQLLKDGLYQEAIWSFADNKEQEKSIFVRAFLRNIMEQCSISKKDVSYLGMGGVTNPMLVQLPYDVGGVFKEKKKLHPSSNYKSEIAAYLLDELVGFNLVPMTIKKEILGKKGSIQYFVKSTQAALKFNDYRKSGNLMVFDYLIGNRDRTGNNVLVVKNREVGIDHGLALQIGRAHV